MISPPPTAGGTSDLSVKRNFGLLLARLSGWSKIVFIDDDITLSRPDIARLTDQLDSHQIAGMVCRDFPDNSVVCHARRLAGLPQDVFVTGAVLGVNCTDLPLPFFPDIYNEDWFFFAEAAPRATSSTKAGEARQAEYEPFAEPAAGRATRSSVTSWPRASTLVSRAMDRTTRFARNLLLRIGSTGHASSRPVSASWVRRRRS